MVVVVGAGVGSVVVVHVQTGRPKPPVFHEAVVRGVESVLGLVDVAMYVVLVVVLLVPMVVLVVYELLLEVLAVVAPLPVKSVMVVVIVLSVVVMVDCGTVVVVSVAGESARG